MKATAEHPYPQTFEEFLDCFQLKTIAFQYLEWDRLTEPKIVALDFPLEALNR